MFRYAYGQIEKQKALQEENKNVTFSGVISMANDIDIRIRKRLTVEVAFKVLTINLKGKNRHLMRSVTGNYLLIKFQPLWVQLGLEKQPCEGFCSWDNVEEENLWGSKKRINVGLEMVMEPSLLILDEPTSGLYSSSSQLPLKALRREALEGVTICTVVHQPIWMLHNGYPVPMDMLSTVEGMSALSGEIQLMERVHMVLDRKDGLAVAGDLWSGVKCSVETKDNLH
ncbi:hypothetical protein DITRI_Ditri05aG0011900 [Diplodiscus trichospermus]